VLFNTLPFGIFFLIIYCAYYFGPRIPKLRVWLILAGSIFFYARWGIGFVPFLVGTGLLDFYVARWIDRTADKRRRKLLLTLSITVNLTVLGVFKYFDFFVQNIADVANALGAEWHPDALHLVMPMGISFYTFHSLSYTIDVYRKAFKPTPSPTTFLSAISFFPALVAGPIVRAATLLPQFATPPEATWGEARRGVLLFAVGWFKKTIADLLANPTGAYFGAHWPHSGLDAWNGSLAFVGQLYCDFSGYTDMALGSALLLGFKLPENFNVPYLSKSAADFWRRWHISLSNWFRDYVFMPLALRKGSKPFFRGYPFCMMTTMLLAGLWHGPAWHFVAYGVWWGIFLLLGHWSGRLLGDKLDRIPEWLRIAATFLVTLHAFVIFRAATMTQIGDVFRDLWAPSVSSAFTYQAILTLLLIVVVIVGTHVLDYAINTRRKLTSTWWLVFPLASLLVGLSLAFGLANNSFVYFQF
jgi:D-alanyl-lipoteichoic acid acyltransferase DltB (MBOAT superfamily)